MANAGTLENQTDSFHRKKLWLVRDRERISAACYLLVLALIAVHLYRSPSYDMDSIQYMGNALLMEDTNVVRVHERVYSDLRRVVPKPALEHLLGNDTTPPDQQSLSRQ